MRTILESDKDFICDINAPCFRDLQPEEAEMVRSGKTQVLFRKGDNLTKQGTFASYVLFIITGYARRYIEGDMNRNFNLGIIKPGEFLGLSTVFHENIFSCSSIALTDCQAYLVERETVANVVKQNGLFGFNVTKRYCMQNRSLLNTVSNLMYRQMNGRMAETLLYIDSFKAEVPEIFQLLSRKDLADFAGISMESAVKLLKAFEKDGLVKLKEKDIQIHKRDTLTEISRRG